MEQRLKYLDFFKGIAIIGVVLAHFSIFCPSPNFFAGVLCTSGSRCPQLFFIISAFLTWYSLDRREIGVLAFWRKRFVKIAPLFYVSLLFTGLFPIVLLPDWDFLNIVTHLSFTNGVFPLYINSLMGVEWYIADLALFYFLCPVLRKIAYNLHSSVVLLIVSVVLNIAFTVTTNAVFAEQIANNEIYETYFHTFCIVNQLPVLILGILLYYCYKQKAEDAIAIKRVKKFVLAITIMASVFFVLFHLNKSYLTSSLIAGLLFYCILSYLPDIQSGGVISNIGKHSYGIYCMHMVVIRSICYFLGIKSNLLSTAYWICLFVVIMLISFVIGRILEKYIKV